MMFKQLKLLQFFPVNGSRRFSSLTKRKVSVNVIINNNFKPFLKIYFDYCKTCTAVSQDANFLDVLAWHVLTFSSVVIVKIIISTKTRNKYKMLSYVEGYTGSDCRGDFFIKLKKTETSLKKKNVIIKSLKSTL